MPQELCKKTLEALRAAGFSKDEQKILVEDERYRDVLRRTFIEFRALHTGSAHLEEHHNDAVLTSSFSPLALSQSEWKHFIDRKNAFSNTECNVRDGKDFFNSDHFDEQLSLENPTILFVDSKISSSSLEETVDFAEEQLRGCSVSTKPKLIFELLSLIWDDFPNNKARFIAVPTRIVALGKRFPVIIKKDDGIKTLALTDKIPSPSVPGFYAFCGSQKHRVRT